MYTNMRQYTQFWDIVLTGTVTISTQHIPYGLEYTFCYYYIIQ